MLPGLAAPSPSLCAVAGEGSGFEPPLPLPQAARAGRHHHSREDYRSVSAECLVERIGAAPSP